MSFMKTQDSLTGLNTIIRFMYGSNTLIPLGPLADGGGCDFRSQL